MSKLTHTGNLIIIGFVMAALSMIFLVYKSTQVRFDVSTTEDPYSKEVEFNRQLVAQKSGNSLGEGFNIKSDSKEVIITIPADISRGITKGLVSFYCYSDSKMDKTASFSSSDHGVYRFPRSEFMTGHNYNVKVAFTSAGKEYFKEMKIF